MAVKVKHLDFALPYGSTLGHFLHGNRFTMICSAIVQTLNDQLQAIQIILILRHAV